jgi:hypothetical protein
MCDLQFALEIDEIETAATRDCHRKSFVPAKPKYDPLRR